MEHKNLRQAWDSPLHYPLKWHTFIMLLYLKQRGRGSYLQDTWQPWRTHTWYINELYKKQLASVDKGVALHTASWSFRSLWRGSSTALCSLSFWPGDAVVVTPTGLTSAFQSGGNLSITPTLLRCLKYQIMPGYSRLNNRERGQPFDKKKKAWGLCSLHREESWVLSSANVHICL